MNQVATRPERIKALLTKALTPIELDVQDKSHLHVNHPGAKESGGGHFDVYIMSEQFQSKTPIQRHRLVYAAVDSMMGADIHALSIQAVTPEEAHRH